jgi:glycosyltransferase involved in cell wall biosynthesis
MRARAIILTCGYEVKPTIDSYDKLLFLAYYFPPLGGSAVQRALKIAEYFPDDGLLPIIITAPAATTDRWAPQDLSLGRAFADGVSVHHIEPIPKGRWDKVQARVARWMGLRSRFWEWWVKCAVELGVKAGSDARLILATMPPYESAAAAVELSARLKLPWVADMRDPWALDETQLYPTLFHRRLELKQMEHGLSTASLIIMNTPQAAEDLKASCPALRDKPIMTITNGFAEEDFADPVPPRNDSKFRVVHSGIMFTRTALQLRWRAAYRILGGAQPGVNVMGRSASYLLEALRQWQTLTREIGDTVEAWFAGETTAEEQQIFAGSPVSHLLRATGHLPHRQSVGLIRTADLLFLPMHSLSRGNRARSVPGKLYEYMASGRPILAAVPDGDARDFLTQCGTAHICRPDDVDGMVRLLDRVYRNWKAGLPPRRPDAAFLRGLTRRSVTHRLAVAIRSTVLKRNLHV